MKIYIGPYKNYIGPYQIAEKILFWKKPEDDHVYALSEKLSGGILSKFLEWVSSKRKRTIKIRIDKYDTWSMDATLALIVLPMLKQLQATKHGSHVVDLEDVPENLRCTNYEEYESQQCFDFYHDFQPKEGDRDLHTRWDWVIGEMIWAMEQLTIDWESQYYSGEIDLSTKVSDNNSMHQLIEGPNHTFKVDMEGLNKHQDRIRNGLQLFGKYFQGLWD